MGRASPEYDSISRIWVGKRIINYYQCWMRHICLDESKYTESSA